VSTSSLVLCKGISAALWITAGSIMGGLSLLIITGCTSGFPDLFQGIGVTISTIWEKVGAGSILVGAEILLLFLLGGAEMALKIYAAISVGHQCGSHRILGAIGAYLGFGIVEVIVMNFLGILGAEIGIDARLSAFTQGMGTVASLQVVLLPMMASVLALGGIYYTVTYILMKNRLNLE
ncbi:MAG: hypothetical protein RR661_06440, partial [Anaerovoracaceae bacterium]